MNNTQTIEKLKEMKLLGMQQAYQACMAMRDPFTADQLIAHLTDAEWESRQTRKIQRLIQNAHFRYQAGIEEIDFRSERELDKNLILRLADCSFIEKAENILIEGATGTGKSFLASAIGHKACLKGYKVAYFGTGKLFASLKMARADASHSKILRKIERTDLLILDDFGLWPLDQMARLDLMEIIEDRNARKATIIASQIPAARWYELIEEQTIADAILDRITHASYHLKLKGESLRKRKDKR